MLFSSISFLYGFLPAVLAVYYAVPDRFKNHVLLASSLLFYFFGEPVYVALLLVSACSDWLHSLLIEANRHKPGRAKALLVSSLVINIALLGFFKYAAFFTGSLNAVFGLTLSLPQVRLPIGISFYTFQTMSYTIDVYRGRVRAQKNLATLATFVCLFPQLIAGPIVRYAQVENELALRRHSVSGAASGLRRFVLGLSKKVLLANVLGEYVAAFRAAQNPSVLFYWLYALAFSLQLYFDFSAYSDMAVGLGRLFGFDFPENFDHPFCARSISDFWRRWHQTLGSWFRDYVYIPLGGNRTPTRILWVRNVLLVWCLTGLWHGADWHFVLWGLYFGLLLLLEKTWLGQLPQKAGPFWAHSSTFLLVVLGFVLFNADGLAGARSDFSGLFGLKGLPWVTPETLYVLRGFAVPLLIALVGATPLPARWIRNRIDRLPLALLTALLLLLSTAFLVDGSFNPFLYFRF